MRTDRTDFRANVTQECGVCHAEQAATFFDTFHGKATQLGSSVAAHCYDCHGTHAIHKPSDPRSTLGEAQAVATCRKCHAGATAGFTGYLPHATPHDREHYPWLFWTYVSMSALLVGTMAVALLHSLLWLVRLLLTRGEWRAQRALAKAPQVGRVFLRFTAFQRTQHLLLMLSFFDLALTGMALKFSWARWAQVVAPMLGGPESMHVLHRLGAITLLAVFAVHVLHVLFRKRADRRSWRQMLTGPNSILFGPRDLKELRASLRWFVGRGPRPRFDRYTYWEKFDYFAVFWGVAVIGATGLLLWFPELATRVMPGWLLNVAGIVHGDEALMAVVFIFTIHFFNSHFRPDKFPLDTVMFTGRVGLEELRHERPLEYERLEQTGELERRLVDALPPAAQRAARVFGYLALGLGVVIVAMILWALFNGSA
jgi:cytochrome b subunit of formate dehydrogenase